MFAASTGSKDAARSRIIAYSAMTVDFLIESKMYPSSLCAYKLPTAVSKVVHLLCTFNDGSQI